MAYTFNPFTGSFDNTPSTLKGDEAYSTLQSASGDWSTYDYVDSTFLPLTGGIMTGKLIAAADASTSRLNIGNAISLPEPSFLVNGDIWITSGNRIGWRSGGVTYASAITNLSNTFNQPQIINLTSSVSPALRITQNGNANALVVEDSTNPDATPFVVDATGSVGIGLSSLSGINAKLTVVGNISSTGIIYASVGNSDSWNSTYSTVQAKSATEWDNSLANQYAHTNFLPLSGGVVTGPTRFNNNVTIFGDLSCSGTQTFANTVFTTTSAVSVVHFGAGPALWVGNNGPGDIASFYDTDQGVEVFHVGGANGDFPNVGVKTSTPNKDFTVNGELSASSTIWAKDSNSDQWTSVYSTVQANSSINWNYQGTDLKDLSANWQSTYTTVESNSSKWESVYSTVLSNSSVNWNYQGTDLKGLSANWESTYTTLCSNSATWATYNFVNSTFLPLTGGTLSGNFIVGEGLATLFVEGTAVGINTETPNEALTVVGNISATGSIVGSNLNVSNWDSVYSTVLSNSSINWNYQGTDLKELSANWQETYTTVLANSATNWNYQGTDLKELSGNWQSTFNTVQTNSATNWDNSLANQYTHTNFLPLSGGNLTGNLTVVGDVSATGSLELGQSGSTVLYADSSGLVGINTETPNEALTVVGNISATNKIYTNSIELSDVEFTNEYSTNVSSITASNDFLKVIVGGNTRYLRLFDVQ